MVNPGQSPQPTVDHHQYIYFTLKWAPRAIVAGVAGYYSLGFAYDKGIMAAIDRLAISIFRHTVGYTGIGAFMPAFQWYSAWGVRMTAALGAGVLYDVIERVVRSASTSFTTSNPQEKPSLIPAPLFRHPYHHSSPLHIRFIHKKKIQKHK